MEGMKQDNLALEGSELRPGQKKVEDNVGNCQL